MEHLSDHFNDPEYWGGGTGHDGYQKGGYRDFDVNQLKIEHILRFNPKKVLDVGCAYGFIVDRLRKAGVLAWGLDISDYAISKAEDWVRPNLYQGMAHQIPWPDDCFDTLVSFGMLEHVTEELLVPTLKEFARVSYRGILSVTMKGDPCAEEDSSHTSLLTYRQWQKLVAEHCGPGYQVYSDAVEWWWTRSERRWALVSPTIYPLGKLGYAGIERLAVLFLRELAHEARTRGNWEVLSFCTQGSVVPRGVKRVSTGPPLMDFSEPNLGPSILPWGPKVSCWLDFSHSKHLPHPLKPQMLMPQISVIWHDPYIMQPSQPETNVAALSQWQAERFREIYNQECIVLDPHCGDGDFLCPGDEPPEDYLVFLGKLSPDKGALEAIEACRALKQKLIIIGPVTPGDPPEYVNAVISACDGQDIIYHRQVAPQQKVQIFQNAKALFYPVSYPEGQGESHMGLKSIEAMLCGTPCIIYDQGAMKEVVDEGVTGFVIPGRHSLEEAIKSCETLDRRVCREQAMIRWDYRNVVQRWLPIMDLVSRGDRW